MKQCKRCGIGLLRSFYQDEDLCIACNSIKHHEMELEALIKNGASKYDIDSMKEFIEQEKSRWDNLLKQKKEQESNE